MMSTRHFKKRLGRLKEFNIPLPQNTNEFRVYCSELYKNLKDKAVYLEIGSRHGGSLYLASGFLQKGSTIICIDLQNSLWGVENSEIKLEETCALLNKEGYVTHTLFGNSRDPETITCLRKILNVKSIDAIFFDGDHTDEGINADWNNYHKFVRPNGLFGFHDIRKNKTYPKVEVYKTWNKLKQKHPHLEVVFEHGIGILWNKELK
ncbi:MAG: class I SAM-dependent methyltransferase [Candidatus Brocadiaceae bacterium]|nr:class I SAM-dependent methyltransferase [Candidatus Brocadiaceae bacterium]